MFMEICWKNIIVINVSYKIVIFIYLWFYVIIDFFMLIVGFFFCRENWYSLVKYYVILIVWII